VVIALGGMGALGAEVSALGDGAVLRDPSGKEVLRSTDLYVVDATGQKLLATLDTGREGLAIRIEDRGAVYPIEVDPLWIQQQKLMAGDGAPGDVFGTSVAISGDTAIVGAPNKASYTGAAYVFTRADSSWTQQQRLTSSSNTGEGQFGSSVAVSGDTVVVNRPGVVTGSGVAADVFVQSSSANCTNMRCPPSGPCQEAGTCSPLSGACTYPPKNEGLPCDDGNACTNGDMCRLGACKGIENPCKAPDLCHGDGACDPATGACVYPSKADCAPPPEGAGPPPVVSGKLKNCQSDDDCTGRDGQGRCSEEHVCCDTPCDETCKSCRLPGSEGTCTEELHTDLKHDCGPSGYCLTTCVSGQCVPFTGKRQCAPFECTDRTHVAAEAFCQGTETECPLAERASLHCDSFACDQIQAACLTACATVNDCAPPLVCSPSHTCVPAPGVAVGTDRACTFTPASPAGGDARGALAMLALAGLSGARRRKVR
jgi:MYXO-CTERM domain-containing protein